MPASGSLRLPLARYLPWLLPDVMSKVRTIADIEGVAIKEIIGVGLDMFIRKYEELHGKVRVKKPRKGDISQIFNS